MALLSMLAIGSWVGNRIRTDAIDNTGANTARFMDSFISPLAQELQSGDTFSIGPIRALDEIMESPAVRGRVVSVKIWKPGGRIAYARDVDLIGRTFPMSPALQGAFEGRTVTEFNELEEAESRGEAASGIPLLEVYSPIHADWSGEIIGVVEFYENATALSNQLKQATLQAWLVTAAVTALICLSLFGIVRRGSRTIISQRKALASRLEEVQLVAQQNESLRQQVEKASRRLSELTEAGLRRVGADLHDGPAQLIGLVALRLDALRRLPEKRRRSALDEITSTLDTALSELRQISRGLVLPELDELTLDAVIERAISSHEIRTHTSVDRKVALETVSAPEAFKICVYRFIQEGLNNAFRHAAGAGQVVIAAIENDTIHVRILNDLDKSVISLSASKDKLGLHGLRERVESLGGIFDFRISNTGEAVLDMKLRMRKDTSDG